MRQKARPTLPRLPLIAGIAIFPFVLAFDLMPTAGAGLVFITLPAASANHGKGPWPHRSSCC